jgi:hypothetical protein
MSAPACREAGLSNRTQANKKPGLNKGSAGINLSPACLASYLTWLQAGRLK